MKLFLTITFFLAIFATVYGKKLIKSVNVSMLINSLILPGETLNCYNCNSKDDPNCLDKPTETMDCGRFIADLSSDRFRCMTVHAGSGSDRFVLRRCSVNNECQYQVENKKFGWSDRQFTDANCSECQSRLCNKD